MSGILSRWLNHEVGLSETVDPRNFAKDFSSGYLFGEILHKYQRQEDFNMFLKSDTSISKLSNFSRLEPSLQLLGVFFDKNTARDLMQEKQGVATNLLYQLYVALEGKKSTGASRTVMQPTLLAEVHKKRKESCSLPIVVEADAGKNLRKMAQHYAGKSQHTNDLPKVTQPIRQKKLLKVHSEKSMEKSVKVDSEAPDDFTGNDTNLSKQLSCSLSLSRRKKHEQLKDKEARLVQAEIAAFEAKQYKHVTSGFGSLSNSSDQLIPADSSFGGIKLGSGVPGSKNKPILQSNSKYIQGIRQRMKENAVAREERQKRVDRFLLEQSKALEAQQEMQLEDQLVRRLTRQTQQEQRLAEQLMQIRRQKEVIVENWLFRERQYQQQRERDFQEALNREAVLAQQAKLAREEEIKKELELCNRLAAERAQRRHEKHVATCSDLLGQIVDLATKVGECRLSAGSLLAEKKSKELKELFLRGVPLYEPRNSESGLFSSPNPSELKKHEILNNLDYNEYTNMFGEWAWPTDSGETKLPPSTNSILAHVLQRLRKIAHPPAVESSAPSFSQFRIKACVLSKFCSGKTSCMAKIGEALGICVLSTDTLIDEALRVFKDGEEITDQQGKKDSEPLHTSSTSLQPDLNKQEEKKECSNKLPTLATLGVAAVKEMRKGNVVPNELMVDMLVEAISQVPAQSGWILDGFPLDISQAHMLEKALGGSVEEESDFGSNTTGTAADPDVLSPLPPHPPVLDLAMLLDIPDECVVRRSYSPTDTAAGASPHTDNTMHSAQITHRIAAFRDAWPELEKWFGAKQNILVRINADVEEGELYSAVESVLQEVIKKKHEAPVDSLIEDALLGSTNALDTRTSSVGSCSSIKKEKDLRHSANVSPSSVSIEGSTGGNMIRPDSAFSTSSSVRHPFVNEPLPPHVPEYLCSHWDKACQSYVNNIKQIMQQLRVQLTFVDHHLFNIRERYSHYLGSPDLKQELVSQWQKAFNSIPDDMREDEETKAELHLRMDELQERLWDITDKHREEDEQERKALMCDGWLEEQAAMLINHHSMIMQVELSRFRETLCTLRLYYWSMQRQVPLVPVSKDVCLSVLQPAGAKDQEDAQPHSTKTASKVPDESPSEPIKLSQEKLLSDYEQAIQAIGHMLTPFCVGVRVPGEVQERETNEQETSQEKKNVTKKGSSSAKKAKKEPQPHGKQAAPPSDDPEQSQVLKTTERTHDHKIRERIRKEHTAALTHEENSAKVRLELVKGHGLMLIESLQSRVQETFGNMEKWFQRRYLSEMKRIDQLSEVVRRHIEAGAKLQYELVMEDCDFYLNGDCQLFPDAPPPPRPAPVEKPNRSTLTVAQLESLHCQLSKIAPSGLMSSSAFFVFLEDLVSNSLGRSIVPEAWTDLNQTQLLEMVSLLTDEYELIDWRRFLLGAALPWPLPSLTQLLDLLNRFKEADAGDTGYLNKGQFLQTELWFCSERIQNVPEDPSEPLPFNRLASLRKFFFQLFADPTSSPPQLDYVSMLQYFAADPNPRQGFIRALSVVLGQHLQQPSHSLLVKSLPSLEETTEFTSVKFNEDYKEEEALFSPNSFFKDQDVSISALLNVVCHKVTKMEGVVPLPPGCLSQEEHKQNLENVYSELGYNPDESVPFSILSKHPYTQMLIETSTQFQLVNLVNAAGASG